MQTGRIIGKKKRPYRIKLLIPVAIFCFVASQIYLWQNAKEERHEKIFSQETYYKVLEYFAGSETAEAFTANEQFKASYEAKAGSSLPKTEVQRKVRVVQIAGNAISKRDQLALKPGSSKKSVHPIIARRILENVIKRYGKNKQDPEILAEKIIQESFHQGYDPLFVAAVIKSESAFDSFAKSYKGAVGLMQILPSTGRVIEKLKDFEPIFGSSLTDPSYNLRLGIRYLRYLDEMFNGNKVLVLIAYNWGPGRVLDAFEGKRRVPPEVIRYATKILSDHAVWVNRASV